MDNERTCISKLAELVEDYAALKRVEMEHCQTECQAANDLVERVRLIRATVNDPEGRIAGRVARP